MRCAITEWKISMLGVLWKRAAKEAVDSQKAYMHSQVNSYNDE